MKKQTKTLEEDPSEIEISNLPDKEFKVMVIKMLTKTREEWMNTVRTVRKRQKNKKV